MSATTTPVHMCYFLTSRVPRYPPDKKVYLHENVILGQMPHEPSRKQFLSMKPVIGMYGVGGMGGGTLVVGKVRLA